jgi:hypothetical protein
MEAVVSKIKIKNGSFKNFCARKEFHANLKFQQIYTFFAKLQLSPFSSFFGSLCGFVKLDDKSGNANCEPAMKFKTGKFEI